MKIIPHQNRKFYIFADVSHTRLAAARLFSSSPAVNAIIRSLKRNWLQKYREESSIELILELTGLHQVMSPCVVPGLSKFL